jgi:type IV secretory pathway VirB3-like protein
MHLQLISCVRELFKLERKTETWAISRIAVILVCQVVIKHLYLIKLLNRVLMEDPWIVFVLLLKDQLKLVDKCNFSAVSVNYESNTGRIPSTTFFGGYSTNRIAILNCWFEVIAVLRKEV